MQVEILEHFLSLKDILKPFKVQKTKIESGEKGWS